VLWHKDATSGLVQQVVEMRIDDDQDTLWLRMRVQAGPHSDPASCHVGYRSCFYRSVEPGSGTLRFVEAAKTFEPCSPPRLWRGCRPPLTPACVFGSMPSPRVPAGAGTVTACRCA